MKKEVWTCFTQFYKEVNVSNWIMNKVDPLVKAGWFIVSPKQIFLTSAKRYFFPLYKNWFSELLIFYLVHNESCTNNNWCFRVVDIYLSIISWNRKKLLAGTNCTYNRCDSNISHWFLQVWWRRRRWGGGRRGSRRRRGCR